MSPLTWGFYGDNSPSDIYFVIFLLFVLGLRRQPSRPPCAVDFTIGRCAVLEPCLEIASTKLLCQTVSQLGSRAHASHSQRLICALVLHSWFWIEMKHKPYICCFFFFLYFFSCFTFLSSKVIFVYLSYFSRMVPMGVGNQGTQKKAELLLWQSVRNFYWFHLGSCPVTVSS